MFPDVAANHIRHFQANSLPQLCHITLLQTWQPNGWDGSSQHKIFYNKISNIRKFNFLPVPG